MGVSVSNNPSNRRIQQNREKRQQEMPYVPRKPTRATQITDLVENKTYEVNEKPRVKPRQNTSDTIDMHEVNPQNEGEVNLLEMQNTKNMRATKLKKAKNSSLIMETKPSLPN